MRLRAASMSLNVTTRCNLGARSIIDNSRDHRGVEFLTHPLCNRLCGAMPTNLQINNRLLGKAQKVGGFRTKKDRVNHALSELLVVGRRILPAFLARSISRLILIIRNYGQRGRFFLQSLSVERHSGILKRFFDMRSWQPDMTW